jgi:methylated-DNA-[protein]-cysteine S-methyltransferase
MPQISYNSPVGPLSIFQEDDFIVALDWGWPATEEPTALLETARDQLVSYFNRTLKRFDLPLNPRGTMFQCNVWQALKVIEWGQVKTYQDIAQALKTGPRAIGMACGRNPLPIIIPCHRVIASNGGMGGYSGWDGIDTKRQLLKIEGYQL